MSKMPERIWLEEGNMEYPSFYLDDSVDCTEYIRADLAKSESLKYDIINAIKSYDAYIKMPRQGFNFRKEDAELAWYSALNQLRERVE